MADTDLWSRPRFRNWVEVPRAYQIARRRLAEGLATVELDLPRFEILAMIHHFPGLTQQMLANKLLVGRSNMSMQIPAMERSGLLERRADERDKRVKRLYLTDDGTLKALEGLQIQTKLVDFMMGQLSESECNQMGENMRRIRKALNMSEPINWSD